MLAYLKLMRISALPTLWSNTITAYALVWSAKFALFPFSEKSFWLLLAASTLFYLAGMVLNDFFDAKIDAVERPERMIPSGRVARWKAGVLGSAFLIFAWLIVVVNDAERLYPYFGLDSASLMAALLTLCIVGYNAFLKRIPVLGPVTMGACRFFNILLVFTWMWTLNWSFHSGLVLYPGLVGIYVTAITMLSCYEARHPKIQMLVGWGLMLLIPLDLFICLYFESGNALWILVVCLFFLALRLKRIVPMT